MNSGRDLDALVAEKVMGWDVSRDSLWQEVYEQPDDFVETSKERKLRRTLQPYSTDIATAWDVVDKMSEKGEWTLNGQERLGWTATFYASTGGMDAKVTRVEGTAETAAHSICLAALKAVGYEI